MKTTTLAGSLKALAVIAAFVACGSVQTAGAGETSVYLKSGWFSWNEQVDGSSFVKERGFMHGAGIARKDQAAGLTFAESIEVWGGNLDYDGHDITGASQLKSDTSYLGTKEEIAVGVKLAAWGPLTFEPFASVGHKFWIRTRSSEDWNSFYAKAGVLGELKTAGCTLFLKGGALAPLYTRSHVSLANAGYTDVVTEPKSELSGFAEGGVRLGAYSVSVEYEGMRFGQSAKVATSAIAPNGVKVEGSQAYQPDSQSDLFSLKLAYSF